MHNRSINFKRNKKIVFVPSLAADIFRIFSKFDFWFRRWNFAEIISLWQIPWYTAKLFLYLSQKRTVLFFKKLSKKSNSLEIWTFVVVFLFFWSFSMLSSRFKDFNFVRHAREIPWAIFQSTFGLFCCSDSLTNSWCRDLILLNMLNRQRLLRKKMLVLQASSNLIKSVTVFFLLYLSSYLI